MIKIDEFDSFVEHIVTSPTCSTNRIQMFKQLKLIMDTTELYCCDTDISVRSMKFINHMVGEDNVRFLQYNRNYFSGIPSQEH